MKRTILSVFILALSLQLAPAQQKPVPSTTGGSPQQQAERDRERQAIERQQQQQQQRGAQPSTQQPQRPVTERERLAARNPKAANALTPEKLWDLKRVGGETVSRDGRHVYYGVAHPSIKDNRIERNLYRIGVNGGEPQQITTTEGSEGSAQTTPDGKLIFTHKGQLFVANADGSGAKQITKNENGSYGHVKLSPDGKKILFTREVKMFKTVADRYADLDKAKAVVADELMYRHWDAYADEFVSHPFIADFNGNAVTNEKDLMPDEPYDVPQRPHGGSEDIVWAPDGSYVLYVSKKMSGTAYAISTNSDIYQYTISTGATVNLSEGMKGYDTHPAVSPDGKTIYWLSMARDGFEADKNDVIAYDVATKAVTNLTKGWDNTVSDFVVSQDGKTLYLNAYTQGTKQIFSLDATSRKLVSLTPRQLTTGDFDVAAIVGQAGDGLIVTRTDFNRAPELYRVNLNDGSLMQLTKTNDEAYANIGTCKVEKHWITTSDGQKMLTWIIYPPNFDPSKQYPTLLYCQGGPQSALSQFYSFRWNFQLMASQGYIVIAPNRRGMPGHGVRWNEAISGDWGGQPIRDYLSATDSIARLPFVDRNRIGAVGASYGGYSVFMLAGVHQNRYKTFISHCGLFNLKSWYGSTEEMWFANWDVGGSYWQRPAPESYTNADPINFVQNWNRPMLVIHGGKDFRVPENQGMEAFQLAQLKGIKSRFLYFPEEGHWILQPQNGLLWQREFYRWLEETL